MRKVKDLTGKKFGRLTVIKRVENNKFGQLQWLCKCECGNIKKIRGGHLKSGAIKSCGCLNKELTSKRTKTHGMRNSRIYRIWIHIRNRCYYENYIQYNLYGGRGIKVCEEWKENFGSFYNWAINNGYSNDLTIDRIDVNGDYEPSNCRWVTQKVQANNKRNNHYIEYKNETKTISQWEDVLKIPKGTISRRLYRGWSIERALNTPIERRI